MAEITASGSMRIDLRGPTHCPLPGCVTNSSAPWLTKRHKDTKKHRKQQSPEDQVEVELIKCELCDYSVSQHRLHTLRRHMGSRMCVSRARELVRKGEASKKSGRTTGGAKKRGGNGMVVTACC